MSGERPRSGKKVIRKRMGNTANSFTLRPMLPKKRPAETPEAAIGNALKKFFVKINGPRGSRKTSRYENIRLREYPSLDTGFLSSKRVLSKAAEQIGKARMNRNREYVIAGVVEGESSP